MTEWRCKRDGVLLATIDDAGKVAIRYKQVAYAIEGVRHIETKCRRCRTKNIMKLRINTN